jgi:hypothetical protein
MAVSQVGFCLTALLVAAAHGQAVDPRPAVRNPAALRATELLARRERGVDQRVRFEWDAVPGVAEYLLKGTWIDPTTWAFRTIEFRVTSRTAQGWDETRVALEVLLPAGAHSWNVVALFGPNAIGDFARPTQVSFDLND